MFTPFAADAAPDASRSPSPRTALTTTDDGRTIAGDRIGRECNARHHPLDEDRHRGGSVL